MATYKKDGKFSENPIWTKGVSVRGLGAWGNNLETLVGLPVHPKTYNLVSGMDMFPWEGRKGDKYSNKNQTAIEYALASNDAMQVDIGERVLLSNDKSDWALQSIKCNVKNKDSTEFAPSYR